jgi:hypothetical protein
MSERYARILQSQAAAPSDGLRNGTADSSDRI